jgi:predicted nucleotidyltransferase
MGGSDLTREAILQAMRLKDELQRLRSQILAAAAANGADRVRVFGSVARGDDSADSDVDFLVAMHPGRGLLDLLRLEMQLEAILGRRVDVVTENSLHEAIRATALRQAVSV